MVPTPDGSVTCVVSTTPIWRPAGAISYRLNGDGTSVQVSADGGKTFTSHTF